LTPSSVAHDGNQLVDIVGVSIFVIGVGERGCDRSRLALIPKLMKDN
jgi:hypothetical protein